MADTLQSVIQEVEVDGKVRKYKVTVVKELCIGAVTCAIFAPKTFEMNEENIAVVQDRKWDDPATIMKGAVSCPTKAIIIEDMETGEQLYP